MTRPEEPGTSSQGDRVAELEAQVERLERELESERERRDEAAETSRARAAELRARTTELERVRRDAELFQRRRSVRSATIMAARGRSLLDALRRAIEWPRRAVRSGRRRVRERIDDRRRRASPGEERALAERIRSALPPATTTGGRLVSIIILNRNGRAHLERCLRAVALTAYRDIEILVVDNGSTDGSPELAERMSLPFPIRVIRNSENRSFSEANAQGAAAAAGEFLCFLNNDVDPITEHWLGYLVETASLPDVAAVGARLIYPSHRGGRRAGVRFADLTLQHRGVTFDRSSAVPMPRAMGGGEDPMSADATAIAERPAVTAACLLIHRVAFEAVGGFSTAYDYGLEDVDLCLKLRAAGGRLMYDGRAALWHHESATRVTDAGLRRARVDHNLEAYLDAWGPRIFRESLLDAVEGRAAFSDQPCHVAIAVTSLDPAAGYGDWYTGHELGDALGEFGWRVSYVERAGDGWYRPEPSVDAVIVLLDACDIRRLPPGVLRVGWVRSWPDRWLERAWFDEYDIVLTSSAWIVGRIAERSAKTATLLPLATNPARFSSDGPKPDVTCDVLFVGNYWGQYRDVMGALPALSARGLSVDVYGRGWEAVPEFRPLYRGFLDYADVPRAYASARIVVDDASEPTRDCGSVNSRVFDALAMGAIVVTSGAPGVRALFDDAFPSWSDGASLTALVESILADPQPYVERARGYQAEVLKHHTYGLRAAAVRDRLRDWASATRYALRIGAPSWDVAETWGDYHFARSLQRALERAGHPTRIHVLPEWAAATAARSDVTIHIFGLTEAPTRAGQVNLLWHISHPDRASPELYDRYHRVFVASDTFAARMATQASVPVTALHQATDPERFKPDPTGPRHELLFVANSRSVRRPIVDDLAGTRHDLAVYGRNWRPDLIDQRYVKGEGIPNAELARYYSSADIVLNDHWADMRAEGFISNRIYDALACGAMVISDHVDGIAEEFDGAVATYTERADLLTLVERYLADPEERRLLGERGRAIVIERHTFAARVREIDEAAQGLLRERPSRVFPPLADQAPRRRAATSSAKTNCGPSSR